MVLIAPGKDLMKVGIAGFARAGKTTVFNALTDARAAVGAYGSREANIAVIKVPDARVDHLAQMYKPRKVTCAEIEFLDIAPNESAADKRALDAAALNLLKNVEALVHVVRAFKSDALLHPLGPVDPRRDCEALEDELRLSDLIVIERRIERLDKEGRRDNEHTLMKRCHEHIESGRSLRTFPFSPQELKTVQGYTFLSQKPLLLLGNYGEEGIGLDDPCGLHDYAAEQGLTLIELCGAMEMEIAELPPEDRQAFRDELGLGESSRVRFIQAAYDMLGLMSFLTAGDPEVRAWTIRKGTRAAEAAGVIHSDIQRGFIRAETIAYGDLVSAGNMVKAKELGKVRLEGKDYLVQDGDVMLFRFNV